MKQFLFASALLLLTILPARSQSFLRQYQGVSGPGAGHIRPTTDGGYLLSGSYALESGFAGMLVLKVDGNFQPVWSRVLQSTADHLDYGIDAIETSDGGVLVLGAYDTEIWKAPLLAKLDYCLVKLDNQGQIQWAKRYGSSRTDLPYELSQMADGSYLVSGYSSQGTSGLGNPQPWLIRVDGNGTLLWSHLQTNFTFNIATALLAHPSFQMKAIPTADGGLFYAISSGEWGYLVKWNSQGQIQWQRQLPMGGGIMGGDAQALWGVAAAGGFFADVEELPNGNLALLGNVFYFIALGNGQNGGGVYIPVAFVSTIDPNGAVINAQAFYHPTGQEGNLTDLYASDLTVLSNGHLLVGGAIGGYKAFLAELDPAVTGLDQAAVWARGFSSVAVAGYPYDYDIPRLSLSHQGDYLLWFDNLKLKQIDASQPENDPCSHDVQVISFPFAPQTQQAQISADSLTLEQPVAFTSVALTVTDTLLCESAATSLFQPGEQAQLRLYPNPASDQVWIQLPGTLTASASLEMFDMQGKLIKSERIEAGGSGEIALSLTFLQPGMYLIRLSQGSGVYSGKLLVRP